MPEATPAQAPEAAPAAAAETTAAEPQSSSEIDFNDLPSNPDEIRSFLYDEGKLELPAPTEAAPAEAAAEPVAAAKEDPKSPEATEAAATATEPELPESEPMPGRISTKQFSADEQKAMSLMHAMNKGKTVDDPSRLSIWDAKAMIDAREAKEKPPEAPAGPTPVELANTKVEELRTGLATLREKQKEQAAYGNDTADLDTQIEAAQEEIADARMEAKLAARLGERDQKEQQATQAAAQREREVAARVEAKQAVLQKYPAAADTKSDLGLEVASVITEMQQPNHPDHDLLFTKNAAKFVTTEAMERLAERHKLSLADAMSRFSGVKAAAPVVPAAEAPAAPKVMPAAGNSRTAPPAAAPTGEDVLAQVGDDADAAMKALYGEHQQTFAR